MRRSKPPNRPPSEPGRPPQQSVGCAMTDACAAVNRQDWVVDSSADSGDEPPTAVSRPPADSSQERRLTAAGLPLGRLDQVDPRSVWRHEALNFTPWLLENADRLGEALGVELELTRAEHAVGGYSLDLIGRDMTNGTVVIVENQLADSDHFASGTAAHLRGRNVGGHDRVADHRVPRRASPGDDLVE